MWARRQTSTLRFNARSTGLVASLNSKPCYWFVTRTNRRSISPMMISNYLRTSRPYGYRDPASLGIRHTNFTRSDINELPLIKKLETLSGYRRVDLNLWFETFELEVSQLGVPIEQWVELLARHSDTAMSAHIDNLRRKLLSENTPPMPERLFYRAIRDMLFKDHGMACSAYTYRAWLTQITQGPPCSRHTSRGDGRNVHLRIHRCD